MIQSRRWLIPTFAAVAYALAITACLTGWTWALYDDMHWVGLYREMHASVLEFARVDFVSEGRLRPLSAAFNFGKIAILGARPQALHVARFAELVALLALGYRLLRARYRVPALFAAASVALVLKSPAVLEQLRLVFNCELPALVLAVGGLLAWDRSRPLALGLLATAALFKEPFALLLPLPALLRRETRLAMLIAIAPLAEFLFLSLHRIGYSASYGEVGIYGPTLREFARGAALDAAPLALLPFFLWPLRRSLSRESAFLWRALVLLAFAAAYAVVVLPKAVGYVGIFAPCVVLAGLAAGNLLGAADEGLRRNAAGGLKALIVYVALLACLLPLRLPWNWTRTYASSRSRAEMLDAIRRDGRSGPIASNCLVDRHLFGMMVDGRADGTSCVDGKTPILDCCRGADSLVLGDECLNAASASARAERAGLTRLFGNDRWKAYRCR